MELTMIIKLLDSGNNEDCLIGYELLRKKYWYLLLWMINIFILRKYNVHISKIYFPDLRGASDEVHLCIDSTGKQSWIQIN